MLTLNTGKFHTIDLSRDCPDTIGLRVGPLDDPSFFCADAEIGQERPAVGQPWACIDLSMVPG
jgi:hypothetical protein